MLWLAWWLEEIEDASRYMTAALACVTGSPTAVEAAEGLDAVRLAAWDEVMPRRRRGEGAGVGEPDVSVAAVASGGMKVRVPRWFGRGWQRSTPKASRERAENNAREFKVIADFSKEIPDDWSVDGAGLRGGRVENGEFAVAIEGAEGDQDDHAGRVSIRMRFRRA